VERHLQRSERSTKSSELAGRAKQVSYTSWERQLHHDLSANLHNSSSPLNGQAAELWDKDAAEFKRLVLARHRDLTDEELAAA
jgi:hypothetical protein